jgi:two-component system sensor histidine kinase ChvG
LIGYWPEIKSRLESGWAKFQRRRPRFSALTVRILVINVGALLIPLFGFLWVDQYRQSLIDIEIKSLESEGKIIAVALGTAAVRQDQNGNDFLRPSQTSFLVRLLTADTSTRVRVFQPSGQIIADSRELKSLGGPIFVEELPVRPPPIKPTADVPNEVSWWSWLGRSQQALPLYHEALEQSADHYPEVSDAFYGSAGSAVRLSNNGHLVLSVGIPVQKYRQVLGALMISSVTHEIDEAVQEIRIVILQIFFIALTITIILSLYLSSAIARPVRRLARAADQVRLGQARDVEIPDFTHRRDEIGDLSLALREMTHTLLARMNAIERFAADVSHEIKNPLTSVRSALETLSFIKDPEKQQRLMDIMLEDVQRLDRLITDISDASRLDAELSRGLKEVINICEMLTTLIESHQLIGSDQGIQFALNLPEGDHLWVNGIEGRLAQVLRNLIGNAISFSPEGGLISLEVRRVRGKVEIDVYDQGRGIPEDKLEKIFERFFTDRPEPESFGNNSGLGLSISKQIVEAHGGELTASNREPTDENPTGARFTISLPAL